MSMSISPRSIATCLATCLLIACGSGPTQADPDLADPAAGTASTFTLKMLRPTGENPFAQLAYECDECSFEQFHAIEVPDGWTKAPSQVILPIGELGSTPSFEGVPGTVDFVAEIPGNEFRLIAKALDGQIVEAGPNGLVAVVQVQRDTRLRFPAGSRVHELADPEGNVFVLFAYQVDSADFAIDFQDADALEGDPTPEGWTSSTRILDDDLILDPPNGVATVMAIRAEVESTWELR